MMFSSMDKAIDYVSLEEKKILSKCLFLPVMYIYQLTASKTESLVQTSTEST